MTTPQEHGEKIKRLVSEYGEALVQRGNFPRRDKIHAAVDSLVQRCAEAEAVVAHLRTDPQAVHAALIRGELARPELRALLHVFGEEALDRWDASESAEQRLREVEADAALLDSGRIMLHETDSFGEPFIREIVGINLRAAIGAAIERAKMDAAMKNGDR